MKPLLPDTPSRQVAGAAIAVAAAILVLLGLGQWQSYVRTIDRAERDTRNAAFLLAEHAARTFDGIEKSLRAVARLRGDVAKGIYRSQASINIHLKTVLGGSAILREVGWYNAYGERVATSDTIAPDPVSLAQDELFQAPRDSGGQTVHVSSPALSRRTGAWQISVSMRLEDLDGSFAGVASGTVDPAELAKVYRSLDMGPGLSATLFRRDGVVLAHAPDSTGILGRAVGQISLFREELPNAPSGTYDGYDPFDGTAQIVSYNSVPDVAQGFVVRVAMARDQALAQFWTGFALQALAAGLVLAILFIGTRLLVSALRRRERLQADLAEATATANRARVEAERANSAKSAFLAHMSHELRTPLNAILGFGQLLELDRPRTLTAAQREYAGHVVSSGSHLLDLVNEVLDLAGVESGRLALSLEPLGATEVLVGVRDIMESVAAKAGILLETVQPPSAIMVKGDATRLRQALINLVGNAIKYNRHGGRVTVRAEALPDGRARFSVEDTGKGIAPEHHANLFEPFRRLGAEYTAVEGTGLGLALTKRMVEAMGGSVGFTSEPGVGSTFWLDFPTEPAAAVTEEEADWPTASLAGARR